MNETTPSPLGNVITIDDERIKSHLDRVVRGSVEETLNALLDAEADRLCNAQRYERSEARRDTRAGHYERKLQTKAGEVSLRIPKLRAQTFETAIIERFVRKLHHHNSLRDWARGRPRPRSGMDRARTCSLCYPSIASLKLWMGGFSVLWRYL